MLHIAALLASFAAAAQTYITPVKSDLMPPTPQSAKPVEYQMPQPAMLTGAVDLSIPLYTIHAGNFSLPVYLQYHSNGIKVMDDPCPNGYGWGLMPALRATRTILGRPDELFEFKQYHHGEDATAYGFQCMVNPNAKSTLYPERYDSHHDIITFSLPGKNITRIIDLSNGCPEFRGGNDKEYSVCADNMLDYITVTGPDGTKYVFGAPYEHQPTNWNSTGIRTCWALNEIITISGHKITLHWSAERHPDMQRSFLGGFSFLDSVNIFEWGNSGIRYAELDSDHYEEAIFKTSTSTTHFLTLNSIVFPGGSVEILYKYSYLGPTMNVFRVRNANGTIKTAEFGYDADSRLLKRIVLSDEGVYKMEYNGKPTDMTNPHAQDWWGFYNGKDNHSLTPKVKLKRYESMQSAGMFSLEYGNADRSADAEAMQTHLLKSITYPTGGYSTFEYEPHMFSPKREEQGSAEIDPLYNPHLNFGGGVRVKKIITKASYGEDATMCVSYEYSPAVVREVPSMATFIDVAEAAMSLAGVPYSSGMVGYLRSVNIRPFSEYMKYDFGETPIWYETVTAIHHEGKTVYRHRDILEQYKNPILKEYGHRMYTNLNKVFSQGPQLVAKEIYRLDNGKYTIVEKDSMDFSTNYGSTVESTYIGRRVLWIQSNSLSAPDFENSDEIHFCAHGAIGKIDCQIYDVIPLTINTITERLDSHTHTEHTANGKISTKHRYSYKKGTGLVESVETTTSDGAGQTVRVEYPDASASALQAQMVEAGVSGAAVRETHTHGTATTVHGAEYTRHASGAFLPRRTYTHFEAATDSVMSPTYTYDAGARLTEAVDADGLATTWLWGYGRLHPVYKIAGSTIADILEAGGTSLPGLFGGHAENFRLPSGMTGLATRLAFNPLAHLTSIEQPWGVRTEYAYDNSLRLIRVERNGLVTHDFGYSFGQPGMKNRVTAAEFFNDESLHEVETHYDGIGRPVAVRDLATTISSRTEYDAMGRAARESVPSADTPGDYDWTVHTFEPSPRGITEATMRPGEIWHTRAPAATIRRLTNTATGDYACPRYTTDALGSIVLQRNYAPGTLAVTEATDEDGHIVREFRDMDGRTVMTAEGRGADMLRTRRVYDAYGRLRAVLPPSVADGSYAAGHSTLDEFAFLYSYDSAGRLVSAKTPGCAPAHTRYSRAGRVIATRTPAMPAGQWIMHFYDRYGREVLSAIMPATEGELKTIAQNLPVARHTGRDALTAGYTFSPALPFAKTTHTEPLVAVYFDNYDFISDIGDDGAFLLATGHLAAPKGLATGRRDFVAGTAEALYYDTDGFVAERRQLLHAGIRTIAYRRDDQGNPLREDEVFTHTSGKQWKRVTERTYDNAGRPVLVSVTENGVTATTTLSYSPQGHVASEKHSNGVSRLFSHDIHGWLTHTETRVPLRPQIRDSIRLPMLTPGYYDKLPGVRDSLVADVVKPDIRPPIAITESYHDRIFYAEGNAPRFTGCPAARQTSLGGRYDYRFDAHDRLTHAVYTAPTDADTYEDFSVRYTYDNLARPTSVQRHGIVEVDAEGGETFGMLDNLKFRYDGSRLNSISNESDGENYYGRSGYPAVSGSYEWNSAGCLTKDTARRITEISYNHINRPTRTEIGDGNYFYNYYDAEGMLIRTEQTRKRLTAKLVRTYCADRVFIGNNLEYSYFPGGYFDADGAVHFIHSDHQGSVVMVTDSAGQIEQHNSYYPYGEPHRAPEGQPMLYAGKERLAPTAEYDYGARRHFPPALLWYTPDEMAHKFTHLSPYTFCAANPVRYIDLTGREFTPGSMAFIDMFITKINSRIEDNERDINDLLEKIASGTLSARAEKRANKKITKAKNNIDYLNGIISEVNMLSESTQLYDIQSDNSLNIPPDLMTGMGGEKRNTACFKIETGLFEIRLGDVSVGSIAHELMHAYQFETGAISYGKFKKNRNGFPYYDKTDEVEAYKRESFFRNTFFGNKLPSMYDHLQDGPCSIPVEFRNNPTALQRISNRDDAAFRINGNTYTPKE